MNIVFWTVGDFGDGSVPTSRCGRKMDGDGGRVAVPSGRGRGLLARADDIKVSDGAHVGARGAHARGRRSFHHNLHVPVKSWILVMIVV